MEYPEYQEPENTFETLESACDGVAEDPIRYLRPHPTDCDSFISCQWLGGRRYYPHVLSCPPTTEFDRRLMICNFADRRCQKKKNNFQILSPVAGERYKV